MKWDLAFFDFGFSQDNGFTVYQIVPQMNKPALIKTLRKDFELIMFRNMDKNTILTACPTVGMVYHAYPQEKGVNYYVTDCTMQPN